MAIQDSFADDAGRGNEQNFFKAISSTIKDSFKESQANLVRDEVRQIKKFYQNTLDLQKELQRATGEELPGQIQDMMRVAIKGFDNILDQSMHVDSDQAKATLALVDKVAEAKMGAEVVPVMAQLKKISDRQNLQTIANQNAQDRMEITSRALGQSMTNFVSENIDAVSNSDLGKEIAETMPAALAGPFAPLVSALDDLVDFRGIGGKLKQGTANAFNKMFRKSVADSESETASLIEEIEKGADENAAQLRELDSNETKANQILIDIKSMMEDTMSDQFFMQNNAQDAQARFQDELFQKMVEYQNLMEEQNNILEDIEKDGGSGIQPTIGIGTAGGFGKGLKALVGSFVGGATLAASKIKGIFTGAVTGLGTILKGFAGKFLAAAGILHFMSSFTRAVESISNMDLGEIDKAGGFFQALLLKTMDFFTFGLTTKLSDGLQELIAENDIAKMITDPIFEGIMQITDFAGRMFDDPLKTLQDTGDQIQQFFGDLYDNHIKSPLTTALDNVGTTISGIWEKNFVQPFQFALEQIEKFIDKINPFKDSAEEARFKALVDEGLITDNSGALDFRDSKIDFKRLKGEGLSLEELREVRNQIGDDLTDADASKLASLIRKARNAPNGRETFESLPNTRSNAEAQTQAHLAKIAENTGKNQGGNNVSVTQSASDDLKLHNDNATLGLANIATQ